ncbi:MAG: glycosyl hydrolase family protein, partial [Alphaproteobacteria bacterium]|nr:glycosyl hydrolase family protein [Alphaproteobacteria bacterium]
MKLPKYLCLVILCALFSNIEATFAQLTYFPSGTNLCDTGTYKLVYYDEFNGYVDGSGTFHSDVNPVFWRKYDYSVDLCTYKLHATYDAGNVTVGGGICTLAVKRQPRTISSSSGSYSALYSISKIQATSYAIYTKGRFEARVSFPSFMFAHSNFELNGYYLAGYDNPDISVAETYGGPNGIYWPALCYSFNQKIEGLVSNFQPSGGQPAKQWYYGPRSTFYHRSTYITDKFNSFHTYSMEWEENMMYFYIDGALKASAYRYYNFGSDLYYCSPSTIWGYATHDYFPIPFKYHTSAGDQFTQLIPIFESFIDKDLYGTYSSGQTVGEVYIDWFRVWQKTLEGSHRDLCDRNISGVSTICETSPSLYTFYIIGTGAVTTSSFWNWTTSSNLTVVSSTMTSITVKLNRFATSSDAWVKFTDDNPICPAIIKSIRVGVAGTPAPNVCMGGTTTIATSHGNRYYTN